MTSHSMDQPQPHNYNQIQFQNQYEPSSIFKNQEELYSQARTKFIQKVYTILAGSLLITTLFCVWAMNSQSFKNMFINVPAFIILSTLLLTLSIVIGCCYQRVAKYALPLFLMFAIVESIFVGIICSQTNPSIVLTAAGITTVIVITLTIYACYTKNDLTGCGPYLAVMCAVLLVMGICMIFSTSPILDLIYSSIGAMLFCVYLVYDTQKVLGQFQNEYTLDDTYLAALFLYTDIIQIFIRLIRILNTLQNN